jgi:myo-inositol-1(or 4)-monophosphatase
MLEIASNQETPREFESEVEREVFQTALAAITSASERVLRYWPNPVNPHFDRSLNLKIQKKEIGTGNYATIADEESEQIIIRAIKENPLLRKHGILAEESNRVQSDSEWQWVIDPIDGTPPFKNGLPEFGISIGVLKNQEPQIGMIAMPALGQIITARRGKGAELLSFDGKKIMQITQETALSATDLETSLVAYDLGYTGRGKQLSEVLAKIADKIGYPVSYGSSSTGNFRLALGHVSAYFCANPTKYDIGAASVIIPEIGGMVTDMDGKPIDWHKDSVSYLAARTPKLHRELLDFIHSSV